jgi:hypothetical protein
MIGYRVIVPALAAGGFALLVRHRMLRWGATDEEAARAYPGDDLISEATSQTTMAVTLPAPPERVWPWLVQMGGDRGGFYSWDRLDNGGRPSAAEIVPEWQDLVVGDHVNATPDGRAHFVVAVIDAPRTLVLRSDLRLPSGTAFDPRGKYPRAYSEGIWAFHLTPLPDGRTRLVVRTRGRGRPRLPNDVFGLLFGEPAHFIMQCRQFRNLRKRVRREKAEVVVPRLPGVRQTTP